MHVSALSLVDFRSYAAVDLDLAPGVTAFLGPNGHGKTNLVEAVGYLATLGSHRVATDAPLVRAGTERAVVRGRVERDGRSTLVEVEVSPGRANRARINRAPVPRSREVLGLLRTVLFAPEDLALVKGDPAERRRFLDDLLVARAPRLAAVRSDYDRVLRQRNALLKSAAATRGRFDPSTLDAWDVSLARVGGELLAARLALVAALRPYAAEAYAAVAGERAGDRRTATLAYRSSLGPDATSGTGDLEAADRAALTEAVLEAARQRRREEVERGTTLVGPHRDELLLGIGDLPARGYASHGESWSFALALRLGAYDLLSADGGEPVLVLDDVFAELDAGRRARLAARVAGAEQVLVTAAVEADVPDALAGERFRVGDGVVGRAA